MQYESRKFYTYEFGDIFYSDVQMKCYFEREEKR